MLDLNRRTLAVLMLVVADILLRDTASDQPVAFSSSFEPIMTM